MPVRSVRRRVRLLPAALLARPRLSALLGAFCIAFSGVLYRFALVSPETASVFRAVYGLPLLVLAASIERRGAGPLPARGKAVAALAGVVFAADLLFWHHTIDAVGAGLATVLGNLQVVVVAVAAWVLLGERPSARTVAALPVILAGVVLGIVTALSYAGYLMLIRQIGPRRVAEPVLISTATTAVVATVVGLAVGRLDPVPSWPAHGWLALLGVTSQSAGSLLISVSLPRLPAVVTSIILLAQPVMAVFLAMLLLTETPSLAQLAGVALVIGGIALASARVRS